ncbi:hypothetical protein [Sinorhizobium sp. 22678]|uniref:hypothetical protein n=1 Tax=Sinorhizobium sp. 22678 TaxID=3453955 RepID=UPI003F86202C
MTKDGERGIVSRFLCEDTKGAPPTPKHEAAHSCGNGKFGCVTKRHISWKTPAENQADRLAHGTHNRGERCGTSKLTEREAREILSLKGKESQRSIAKRFGIIQQTVSQIHSKKTWAWLSAEEAINSALSRTRSLEAAE